jgi:hypothetical protein
MINKDVVIVQNNEDYEYTHYLEINRSRIINQEELYKFKKDRYES